MTTVTIEEDLLDRARAFLLNTRMDQQTLSGPVLERGEGSVVYDVNGNEFLDFNSGQMCAVLGHNHPRIVEAIKRACGRLIHASSSFLNVEEIRLSEKLAEVLPKPLRRSLFLESGSDSNEAAMAIAKRFTGRYEVASPHLSFHGMGDGARAVTFGTWHGGYGPFAPGTYAIMAPYCYRCPIQQTFPECNIACLDGTFEVLDAQTDGPISAVITEPLFSAGGVVEPPTGWLGKLQTKCKERGALLILDEAQTGLGKLGTVWACEQEHVVPDVLTTSKHFGGGVAISAVSTTDEIADNVSATGFVHGHSHTSDPLACAAASATLDVLVEEDLPRRAQQSGTYWRRLLGRLADEHETIGDVRGRGLLQGIELVEDRESRRPAFALGKFLGRELTRRGLLVSIRRSGSVVRFVPPWTTTHVQMDRAAEILDDAIRAYP